MTGFLESLVGMALGRPGASAARVALPPRFAPRRAFGDPKEELVEDEADAAPAPLAEVRESPRRRPEAHADEKPAAVRIPRPAGEDAAKGTAEARSLPLPSLDAHNRSAPAKALAPERAEPSRSGFPSPVPSSEPRPKPAAQRSTAARAALPEQRMADAVPPPLSRQAAPRAGERAPILSEAAVASRFVAPREQARPVHVTIDRIDVRVAAPQPAAKSGRSKPVPSLSLSDYLKRGGPGGRA